MPRPVRDYEDYKHPEKLYNGLQFRGDEHGCLLSIDDKLSRCFQRGEDQDKDEHTLCWSCGWSKKHEYFSCYGSRLRIFHTRGSVGIWAMGSKWLLRDEPNDGTNNDYITQEFLRKQPDLNVPLIPVMKRLNDKEDKVHFIQMTRVPGVTLHAICGRLTEDQFLNYGRQLGEIMRSWRKFTSPIPQTVDGRMADDAIVGFCGSWFRSPTCFKIGRTNDEWFDMMEKELRVGLSAQYRTRDQSLIDEKFDELKRNFPKSEPYTLTHADLDFTNIIVKDDKIQAIIDWQYAAYLPWWAERYFAVFYHNVPKKWEPFYMHGWDDPRSPEEFFKGDYHHILQVHQAWNWADSCRKHEGQYASWYRPGFCKCSAAAGRFRMKEIGHVPKHVLLDIEPREIDHGPLTLEDYLREREKPKASGWKLPWNFF